MAPLIYYTTCPVSIAAIICFRSRSARVRKFFWPDKDCLDALMPPGEPFVFHDIRRTVRTRLSGIPNVTDLVRELVIGHTKPGLHKVYDLQLRGRERHALDEWCRRLRQIVGT